MQSPTVVALLYEAGSNYRQIFLDGQQLPRDPNPAWLGYSVGHWDGDTLVVETAGFNDRTWLGMAGHLIPNNFALPRDSAELISGTSSVRSPSRTRKP
jgi:hypothetical protein